MRAESTLVTRIRELMESSNPVPATRELGEAPYQAEIAAVLTELRSAPPELAGPEPVDHVRDRPDRPDRPDQPDRPDRPGRRRGRETAWRVLAPVLSGLAVVAVVTSLTIAAGSGPARRGGGPHPHVAASLPRFYVTINGYRPPQRVIVHSTKTGETLLSDRIGSRPGQFLNVAATGSDRVFYIASDAISPRYGVILCRMIISRTGRGFTLQTLPSSLLARFDQDEINGIAVSPDGRKLAVAVQVPHRLSLPRALMAVVPLDGKGSTRVWSAPSDQAFALDPVWTDDHHVAFLWQDRLTGPISNFTGRSQVRQIDTRRPGSDLLSADVLYTSHVGFIQSAFASPHGGPIFASVFSNKPATGTKGVATTRLVEFSPHKRPFLVLGIHRARYHNQAQQNKADLFFLVYGIDPSGQAALVASPHFGVLSERKITPRRTGPGELFGAAW